MSSILSPETGAEAPAIDRPLRDLYARAILIRER